jgi:hypothetical protein
MAKKIFKLEVRHPEFEKDLKKLKKRFKTLDDDLDVFVKTELNLYHKMGIDNGGIFPISGLKIDDTKVFKAKKFACRSLIGTGAKSGIRVIYAYFEREDRIELIEIYYKGDKKTEDRKRIKRLYKR